jgi:protoheme IX farnesyltransferase
VAVCVARGAATVLLQPLRIAGMGYMACALVLGGVLIGWAAAGLRRTATGIWARSLFFYSIVYLTLLFVALVVDHAVA